MGAQEVVTGEPQQEKAAGDMLDSPPPAEGYPTHCLRGLRSSKWVDGTYVKTEAYLPDDRTQGNRSDGRIETSINWEDDSSVIDFSLAQRSQAEHGVARLSRDEVDHLAKVNPNTLDDIGYERDRLTDNPYHGNLLFNSIVPKHVITRIAASLALESQFIAPSRSKSPLGNAASPGSKTTEPTEKPSGQ